MSINTRAPRRGLGRFAAVSVVAVSALAATSVGTAPALASTVSPLHHRSASHVPNGLKGAGSFRLGTQVSGSSSEKVDRTLVSAKGAVDVMVELDAAPASQAFGLARSRGATAAKTAARNQTTAIKRAQAVVESRFASPATKARTLYRSHAVYSGVAVRTDASRLSALAAMPGVKAIHRITPKSRTNSSSVPLIGAPAVWKGRGETGQNVRVGIIDTGIDYTHADFGGPGTTVAYAAAKASPTFTPTAKVVGGYDFAGDAYNADPASPTSTRPPLPIPTRWTARGTAHTSPAPPLASASPRPAPPIPAATPATSTPRP